MPSKRTQFDVAPGVAGVTIPSELQHQRVKGPMTPEDVQDNHRNGTTAKTVLADWCTARSRLIC
jgi:hypothetical protein